jgi:hypothetical protein
MVHGRCQCLRRKCGSVRIGSEDAGICVVHESEWHSRPQRSAFQEKMRYCHAGLPITPYRSTFIDLLSPGMLWSDAHRWCSLTTVSDHGAPLFLLRTWAYSPRRARAPACCNLDLPPVLLARPHVHHCSCLLSQGIKLSLHDTIGDTIGHGHHRPRAVAQWVMRIGSPRLWRLTEG